MLVGYIKLNSLLATVLSITKNKGESFTISAAFNFYTTILPTVSGQHENNIFGRSISLG